MVAQSGLHLCCLNATKVGFLAMRLVYTKYIKKLNTVLVQS